MLQDLRYALRALRRSPGFAALAVLTLALGIGGTTAMFSVVNVVLLRPLPFPRSDELVQVLSLRQGSPFAVSPPDFTDWRADNQVFTELAAIDAGSNALTGDGPAEQIAGAAVTGGFFSLLGVAAQMGRPLVVGDDVVGAERVVVLSHGLWQRRFGGDLNVLGMRVTLDGEDHTVVGVMPAGFTYPDQAEMWTSLAFSDEELSTQRGAHYLDVIARLRPGIMIERADADVRQIAARLAQQYPNTNASYGATVLSLQEAIVGDVRPALRILLGAVALVLLIACVNVANLLLVRASGRGRELAIRRAIGASRGRLARGQLVESLVLAAMGGVVGVVTAVWGTRAIGALQSTSVPRLQDAGVDLTVLGFAVLLTLAIGLLFGLLPAWRATRTHDVGWNVREEGGGVAATPRQRKSRHAMVIAELALALVLLAGAGLLIKSFVQLARVELGIVPDRVLTLAVSLPDGRYSAFDRRVSFVDQLTEQLEALPGVESAGLVYGMPLTGFGAGVTSTYELDGRRLDREEGTRVSVHVRAVTPHYFQTMGIVLRSGRGITAVDREGAPNAMVVSETAARLLWPDADPIGHQLTILSGLGLGRGRAGGEVVGVVGDVRERGPAAVPLPTIFLSLAQWPRDFLGVAVKTASDPTTLVAPTRAAVASVDPDVPVYRVRTLEQLTGDAVAQPRLYAGLLGLFAVVATLLAAIGVYGVVARAVQHRLREVGIRMALGARPAQVRQALMWEGLTPVLAGVVIGTGGALALTRLLQRLLFEVTAWDPVAFSGAALLLVLVAAAATYWPVRRATRVDPMVVLRYE